MDHAADGVVMVKQVVIGGQRAEAGGALEPLRARVKPPAAALVAADDRSLGSQPAVMQESPGHRRGGSGRGSSASNGRMPTPWKRFPPIIIQRPR